MNDESHAKAIIDGLAGNRGLVMSPEDRDFLLAVDPARLRKIENSYWYGVKVGETLCRYARGYGWQEATVVSITDFPDWKKFDQAHVFTTLGLEIGRYGIVYHTYRNEWSRASKSVMYRLCRWLRWAA